MQDIKNSVAIKYIITNKIKNKSVKDSVRKGIVFYLEVLWVIISVVLVLISLEITVVYANILQEGMEKYYLVILVIALVMGSLVIFIEKKLQIELVDFCQLYWLYGLVWELYCFQ